MLKAAFTGGGTGGHVYPALAIIKEFLKCHPNSEILYIGTSAIESKIIPSHNIPFHLIKTSSYDRKNKLSIFKNLFTTLKAIYDSIKILKKFKPHFLLGTGGYVSFPASVAAKLCGIPVFLHEQNIAVGLANKIINTFATKTFVSYENSINEFFIKKNIKVTGNPVRSEIFNTNLNEAYNFFNFSSDKKTILIFGGSKGASSINKTSAELIKELLNLDIKVQIIFITGEQEYEKYKYLIDLQNHKNNLKLYPFLDKIYYALKISDIVICRAGATTLAEITACGCCSILIPYPYATDDHQFKNAMALFEKKAAFVIKDSELNINNLKDLVMKLLTNEKLIKETKTNALSLAQPNAAQLICNEIEQTLKNLKILN